MSRVIYGLRTSLLIGVSAMLVAMIIGAVIGVSAGYYGGWFDNLVMRLVDMLMAIPVLLLALLTIAAFGGSVENVVFAIGIAMAPRFVRIARAPTLSIKKRDYVEAVRALGLPSYRIILFHILPNIASTLIVIATINSSTAIIVEASLSFVGLGVPPPHPSLGSILRDGVDIIIFSYRIALLAGSTITLVVLCLNIIGDALRDALDPRLRGEKR